MRKREVIISVKLDLQRFTKSFWRKLFKSIVVIEITVNLGNAQHLYAMLSFGRPICTFELVAQGGFHNEVGNAVNNQEGNEETKGGLQRNKGVVGIVNVCPVDACTVGIVHACTIAAIVHACTVAMYMHVL